MSFPTAPTVTSRLRLWRAGLTAQRETHLWGNLPATPSPQEPVQELEDPEPSAGAAGRDRPTDQGSEREMKGWDKMWLLMNTFVWMY